MARAVVASESSRCRRDIGAVRGRILVAPMALDGSARGLGPGSRFRTRLIRHAHAPARWFAAPPRRRVLRAAPDVRPVPWAPPGARPAARQARRALVELHIGGCAQRFAQQRDAVLDACRDARFERLLRSHLVAGVCQRDQVGGEVTAVDRGDVPWLERPQVPGLIPVVEVPAKSLQPRHCIERRLQSLDRVERPGPAEVARGDDREQVQAEIGR